MNPRGILLDLDGTLIDSNALHAQAWVSAFAEHGYRLPQQRIALEIGKGGDKLTVALLGTDADAEHGNALRKAQGKHFAALARGRGIRLLDGAEELLRAVRARGIKTALCTSSGASHLRIIAETTGVDFGTLVDIVITIDDAANSKPAGDSVSAALGKLGLFAGACVMIGDTPFDAQAAGRAGVVTIGIDGGDKTAIARLRAGGARHTTHSPATLVADWDDLFDAALPLPAIIDRPVAERLMRRALDVAAEGLGKGEAPIGCVIADRDGNVRAAAHNEMNARQSKIAHAEIVAFERLAAVLKPEERDLILVSTLEPCVMCAAAAMEGATDTILYGLHAPSDGGHARVTPPSSPESTAPRIIGGVLVEESRALLRSFLTTAPPPAQAAYVSKLLAET